MDWEFSSAFNVESLSTQIYAAVAPRSRIRTRKAWRLLFLHKACQDLPFFLRPDEVCENHSASCCFYWGTALALNDGLLLHDLRTLAGFSSNLKKLLVKQVKVKQPNSNIRSCALGRSLHSLFPKLLRVCRWKSQESFYDRCGSCTVFVAEDLWCPQEVMAHHSFCDSTLCVCAIGVQTL